MKMFNPVMVGQTKAQDTVGGPEEVTDPHAHSNLSLLDRLSLDVNGMLMFDGKPVDTVGQQFVNAAILSQFSVVDEKLYFDGNPVDTVGSVFANDAVLRMFSQSEEGTLLFNGQPIESSGSSLPNADDLARLAVDESGQLTVDGVVVSGGGGAVTLSVTKLGTGTSLVKGFVGNDLQTRSLVAGTNMAFDVTGDEIKLNATLSGAVAAATTFKASDGYAGSNVLATATATQLPITGLEVSADTMFRMKMVSSAVLDEISGASVVASSAGGTLYDTPGFRYGIGLRLAAAGSHVTLNAATCALLNSIVGGTGDFTIEFEVAFSSHSGATQIFGCYAGGGISANDCLSIMIGGTGIYTYSVSGTTQTPSLQASGVGDGNVHHIALVRASGTYQLFVDGVARYSVASSAALNKPSTAWVIGNSASKSNTFAGRIGDIHVHKIAKYTSAFTVPSRYAASKASLNVVDMADKPMAAAFWKQISGATVDSTETATAYLKWLVRDSEGVWAWDASNSVWVAVDPANIATAGMTTTELKSALTNNQWNYRSDVIGFVVALVTTDGTSTPVLTSLTINAVQSADKTAGHSVLNSQGDALPQRTRLKFVGMQVSDDGETTTVTGATTSEQLSHKGASLSAVVEQLVQNSGHIGDIPVDVSAATNGAVLVYSATEEKFVAATPSSAAAGSGLYVTAPFTLAAGEEKTVSHQQVSADRAVYQVDQIMSGAALADKFRMSRAAELVASTFFKTQARSQQVLTLPRTTSTPVKQTNGTLPVGTGFSTGYRAGEYLYLIAAYAGAFGTSSQAIYSAHISTPTTWTLLPNTFPVPLAGEGTNAQSVIYAEGYLYLVAKSGVFRASEDAPADWSLYAPATPVYSGATAIIGPYMYLFGGNTSSSSESKIYRAALSDLSAWTEVGSMPAILLSPSVWRAGGYIFVAGGATTVSNVYSNKVYRAAESDPTTWTQIGTLPATTGYPACVVVGSKVILAGGRTDGTTLFRATTYMSDADNPVTWSTIAALSTAVITAVGYAVGSRVYVLSGYKQGGYSNEINVYQMTQAASASSGVAEFAARNSTMIGQLTAVKVKALLGGVSQSLRCAVCVDGVWKAFNGSSVADFASRDAALAAATAMTLSSGLTYVDAGLSLDISGSSTIAVAVQLLSPTASVYGEIFEVSPEFVLEDSASPLLVSGYASKQGEIGVLHSAGNYSSSNIKNKTSEPMTVVVKVCDGYAG